jgi:cell division protein ZapA (FtsZ GTPase activity inhibitor)
MAALVITDELSEAYGELEDIREGKAGVVGPGSGTSPADARAAEDIRTLVRRIESIARSLEGA